MLTQEIATEIVRQTTIRLNRNINIMNDKGIIIASGNPTRINQAHFGAIEVLQTGRMVTINKNDYQQWRGSLPGINLPIEFQKQIIGVIGITGDPKEIMEFGELVKMITEMMIQQAFVSEQLEWKQRLKDHIFEELLKDKFNEKILQQRLHLINVILQSPYHVAVIEVNSAANQLKGNNLVQIIENTFDEKQTIIGFLSMNQLFVLTSNAFENNVKKKLKLAVQHLQQRGLAIKAGLGSAVEEKAQIRYSFNEAMSALALGDADQSLITYVEIEAKALLNELDDQARKLFYNRILINVPDRLIETLEQFFASDLNIGECAKKMYIHRNSLIYRIKKIKEITGYNPQKLSDVIVLQLAVWLKRMDERQ